MRCRRIGAGWGLLGSMGNLKHMKEHWRDLALEIMNFQHGSFEFTKEHIDGMLGSIGELEEMYGELLLDNIKISVKNFSDYFQILDIMSGAFVSLFAAITQDWKDQKNTIKGGLGEVAHCIADDIITIKRLLLAGSNVQARVILRHAIELFDLAICFVSDEGFIGEFASRVGPKEDEMFKPLKKGKLSRKAEGFIRKNSLEHQELAEYLLSVRKEYMSILSNDVHASFNSLITSVFVDPVEATDGLMKHSVGGRPQKGTAEFIVYSSKLMLTYANLIELVFEKTYGFHFKSMNDSGSSYYANRILASAMCDVMIDEMSNSEG